MPVCAAGSGRQTRAPGQDPVSPPDDPVQLIDADPAAARMGDASGTERFAGRETGQRVDLVVDGQEGAMWSPSRASRRRKWAWPGAATSPLKSRLPRHETHEASGSRWGSTCLPSVCLDIGQDVSLARMANRCCAPPASAHRDLWRFGSCGFSRGFRAYEGFLTSPRPIPYRLLPGNCGSRKSRAAKDVVVKMVVMGLDV